MVRDKHSRLVCPTTTEEEEKFFLKIITRTEVHGVVPWQRMAQLHKVKDEPRHTADLVPIL
jgi:hypothetical protein